MDSSNKYIQLVGGFIAVIFGVLQGIDWLFKRFEIDSLYFNIILIILLIAFIISISIYFLRRKKAKSENKKLEKKSKVKLILGIILTGFVLLIFVYFFRKINNNQTLVGEVIPELIEIYDEGKIPESFLISKSLLEKYPNNEIIKTYFDKSSKYAYLKTDIDGVEVSVLYPGDTSYVSLGKAPPSYLIMALAAEILPFFFIPISTSTREDTVGPVALNTSSLDITIFTGCPDF